jgi:hypothetical protein
MCPPKKTFSVLAAAKWPPNLHRCWFATQTGRVAAKRLGIPAALGQIGRSGGAGSWIWWIMLLYGWSVVKNTEICQFLEVIALTIHTSWQPAIWSNQSFVVDELPAETINTVNQLGLIILLLWIEHGKHKFFEPPANHMMFRVQLSLGTPWIPWLWDCFMFFPRVSETKSNKQ